MRNSFSLEQNKKQNIDVLFYYNGRDQYARPVRLTWDEQEYNLGGVQFWYTEHKGDVLVHHYKVGDETGDLTFELSMETDNLTWKLEKVVSSTGSSLVDIISNQLRGASA